MSNQENADHVTKDNDAVLAQWQTCVEMASEVSSRRDSMNNLFVTINLGLLATISFFWKIETILLIIAGICICVLWLKLIANYKHLNEAKYTVITDIEKKLPYKAFYDEWLILENNKSYKNSTALEKALPIAFLVLYSLSIICIFCSNYGG